MAKMFYTMEETKAALAKNEEEIKQLSREGRLREFRDGPRLMFKADQVEQIKSELGGAGSDAVSLSPSESGAPLSLAGDSKGGSAMGFVDSTAGKPMKEDTQFPDLDIGAMGGGKSPGDSQTGSSSGLRNLAAAAAAAGSSGSGLGNLGGSGAGSGGSGVGSGGSRSGVNIFDVDDSEKVDPSAQTAINANVQEQVNLDGVGSGSGLLDLTRESDDTSLGAVFDELSPGTPSARRAQPATPVSAMETQAGSDIGMPVDRSSRSGAAPIYIEEADAVGVAFAGASLAAAAVLCFGGFILAAVLAGYRPDVLNNLRLENSGKMYLLIGAGVVVLFGIIGFLIGKSGRR